MSLIPTEGDQQDRSDELFGRLRLLSKATQLWLQFDRAELKRRVCDKVLTEFRAIPSPEATEGVDNSLAFLRHLLEVGSDNGLCEITMEQLDREIYSAVAELDDDEQVALLLPMVGVEDLAAEWDADEWAEVLRTRLAPEWEEEMRAIVLLRVEMGRP